MPFCAKCGAQVAPGVAFCPSCGAAQSAAPAGGAPAGGGQAAGGVGMEENVAGLLCYVLGWITGLIFLLIDKRPFVRFHAAQSLVTFGGLHVLSIILAVAIGGSIFAGGMFGTWTLFGMILAAVRLIGLIAWILCMVKAFQHEHFKLPFVGDIAENIAGK